MQNKKDVIDFLKIEHHKIDHLLQQLESSEAGVTGINEKKVLKECCVALRVHSDLEEMYFYPACNEYLELELLIAKFYKAHQKVEDLIDEIQDGPNDEELSTIVDDMIKAVRAHVHQEEHQLFPQLQRLMPEESRIELRATLIEAKRDIMEQGRKAA